MHILVCEGKKKKYLGVTSSIHLYFNTLRHYISDVFKTALFYKVVGGEGG